MRLYPGPSCLAVFPGLLCRPSTAGSDWRSWRFKKRACGHLRHRRRPRPAGGREAFRRLLRTCSCALSLPLLLFRPGEAEDASLALGRIELERSAEDLDVLAHHGEPHSAALHLIPGLERLEHLENLVMELRRDAGAVVLDREGVVRAAVLHR